MNPDFIKRPVSFTESFRHQEMLTPIVGRETLYGPDHPVNVSTVTQLHAGLLQRGIEDATEVCIHTPTAKPEHLSLLAVNILLLRIGSDRDIVYVLSDDTTVRSRFRELSPPAETSSTGPFAENEFPVANVTSDGALSRVSGTSSEGNHPRFVFSYTSKRIPSDVVGDRVACVLFDESVKITEERITRLRNWRSENGVPTIAYFTSDPLNDLYQTVSQDALTWTWPLELLDAATTTDERRDESLTILEEDEGLFWSDSRGRIRSQLRNRAHGVDVEINVPGGEEIEQRLGEVQTRRFEFEQLVREYDVDALWAARRSLRYAIRDFEELLTPIEIAEIASSQSRRRSLSARLSSLEQHASTIGNDPDAAPATGTYRDVLTELTRLQDAWPDIPEGQKKAGQLVNHLLSIRDDDESVAIVTPTAGAAQAVVSHLQSKYGSLYSEFDEDLHVYDPGGVRSADPVDHVLLYGAPRYDQRDLLRLAIAPHLVVLAYPSELRLLRSQVSSFNDAFEDAATGGGWELARSLTGAVCGPDVAPTVEQIDVTVPEVDERTQSTLASGSELREDGDTADLADLVRTFDPSYEPPDQDVPEATTHTASRGQSTTATCLVFRVEWGGKLYSRPDDEVTILRTEHETILTKAAEEVTPPATILHFRDTDALREELYGLIRERGDAKLAFYANSWRVYLEEAIQAHDDDLDDFIHRLENVLDEDQHKVRQTYRGWYNLDVRRTRSKDSLRAIAEAYDLTFVQENFSTVWQAAHDMENLYQELKQALRNHALRAATTEEYEDTVVSENPRIQLSDFDIDQHLLQLPVVDVEVREDVPLHRIGTYDA